MQIQGNNLALLDNLVNGHGNVSLLGLLGLFQDLSYKGENIDFLCVKGRQ
jgi:hypothetical protein